MRSMRNESNGDEMDPVVVGRVRSRRLGWHKAIGWILMAVALASAEEPPTWLLSLGGGAGMAGLKDLGDENYFSSATFGVKHRLSSNQWLGLVYGSHVFPLVMDGAYRERNELHTLTPTISWMSFGDLYYLSVNTGAGLYLLRHNDGPHPCGYWNSPGRPSSCASGPDVPTIWSYDLGLLLPVGVEAALRYGPAVLSFQPQLGGVIPMTDRPTFDYWGTYHLNLAICF